MASSLALPSTRPVKWKRVAPWRAASEFTPMLPSLEIVSPSSVTSLHPMPLPRSSSKTNLRPSGRLRANTTSPRRNSNARSHPVLALTHFSAGHNPSRLRSASVSSGFGGCPRRLSRGRNVMGSRNRSFKHWMHRLEDSRVSVTTASMNPPSATLIATLNCSPTGLHSSRIRPRTPGTSWASSAETRWSRCSCCICRSCAVMFWMSCMMPPRCACSSSFFRSWSAMSRCSSSSCVRALPACSRSRSSAAVVAASVSTREAILCSRPLQLASASRSSWSTLARSWPASRTCASKSRARWQSEDVARSARPWACRKRSCCSGVKSGALPDSSAKRPSSSRCSAIPACSWSRCSCSCCTFADSFSRWTFRSCTFCRTKARRSRTEMVASSLLPRPSLAWHWACTAFATSRRICAWTFSAPLAAACFCSASALSSPSARSASPPRRRASSACQAMQ
mmetsp:Transcript_39281/g.102392  ORF Transcript_39281/g.102392 Transcript_39281/m.102392 type:complete len:452 (+) Transcript_39281:747-2102(+)